MSMCPEIFNTRAIVERVLNMYGAASHVWAVQSVIFSLTAITTHGQVEEDPMHGIDAHQIWILWISTCGDICRALCMQFMLATKRHFIARWIDAWQNIHNYPGIFEGLRGSVVCRGVHWISWGIFWALILNLLLQLKLSNYSGYIDFLGSRKSQLILFECVIFRVSVNMDIFSWFGIWNSCPNFIRTFHLHSHVIK
jgi:hypothetical protein